MAYEIEKDVDIRVDGTLDRRDDVALDIEDDELVRRIDGRIAEAKTQHDDLARAQEDNERYWLGKQLDLTKLYEYQTKAVDNRIFLSVETMVPIITSRTPEPTILCDDAIIRRELALTLQGHYEVQQRMQQVLQMVIRHQLLYRVGFVKVRWDDDRNDIVTEWVRPQRLLWDPRATSVDDADYIIELMEDTIGVLIEKYPGAKGKLLKRLEMKESDRALSSRVQYVECWMDDMVVWKFGNVILDKRANPYYLIGEDEKYNLTPAFRKPRKPYIAFRTWNIGRGIADDVTPVDVARSLQDLVNKRKRQISDNASDNGVLIGSGDGITKEALESYTGAPNERLWIPQGDPARAVTRLPSPALAAYVYQDLLHSISEIDNVMGTHSTTRGERGAQETATGRTILRDQDVGRQDLVVRNMEQSVEELYAWWIQLMQVGYTEPRRIATRGEVSVPITYDRRKVARAMPIQVMVKQGSTLPIDRASQRQEALELAQYGLIDPLTLYERLDFPNVQEAARRLIAFKTNPAALLQPQQMSAIEGGPQAVATEPSTPETTIQQARQEQQEMAQGQEVPPFSQATPEHLLVHTRFMQGPEFQELPEEIQMLFIPHVRAEQEIVQRSLFAQ
ncbi:MAG: hypothetical protein QME66_05435 [Candidatus Eisenbacteria bacterium]|nr:hypothetical protein [Candidatus Eisenbacteria bacterium]